MNDFATPAATVVLLRDGACGTPEFLMITRAAGMGFAGGAVAFPGGKVDAGDHSAGAVFCGFSTLPAVDAAARVAAARETFEEAGILLSSGPVIAPAARLAMRGRLMRHAIDFAGALASFGHTLAADFAVPFARWVPPAGLHRRFDTLFYLAALPAGEVALADGHETTACAWFTAADALAAHAAGQISLLFPTRCNVERLGQFDSIAALLAHGGYADVQPDVMEIDGVAMLTIPEGIGYPITRRPVKEERRG
jgi:8-oxo-dGTP pyrophosphatase MutT (NUDIX family)